MTSIDQRLLETLRDAQRFGFFGSRPIEDAAEHSIGFVDAIGPLARDARLIDVGSGGGLPGLVLAARFPETSITLVDRREKRTDFLRRATVRLGFEHVTVVTADVEQMVRAVGDGSTVPFDVVTARGFGPPDVTLRVAVGLLAPRGRIVVSDPPTGDRWDPRLVTALELVHETVGHVSVFHRPSRDGHD